MKKILIAMLLNSTLAFACVTDNECLNGSKCLLGYRGDIGVCIGNQTQPSTHIDTSMYQQSNQPDYTAQVQNAQLRQLEIQKRQLEIQRMMNGN